MPVMDGFKVLEYMQEKKLLDEIPVILIHDRSIVFDPLGVIPRLRISGLHHRAEGINHKLIGFPDYRYCYNICRHHHERWDGRGYPDHLTGDQIPICAQIVAVADVYDALVSPRVYKSSFSCNEAFEMIIRGECGQFGPDILECFRLAKEDFFKMMEVIGSRDFSE